jgi:hypothetical protein
MANDTVKSQSLTYLDTVPIIESNAGNGAAARLVEVDDYCTATAAGLASSGSYYKLLRLPSFALVKSVILATDSGPNLNGSLCLDLNMIFSDSADDGTPAFLQGLIPTNANTGGTTTIASYSSPNKIFGLWKPSASASAINFTEFMLNGLGTSYAFTSNFIYYPLFQLFGFTDARGIASDPGGYFDLMAYVSTGATTGGACNIYAKVRYAI